MRALQQSKHPAILCAASCLGTTAALLALCATAPMPALLLVLSCAGLLALLLARDRRGQPLRAIASGALLAPLLLSLHALLSFAAPAARVDLSRDNARWMRVTSAPERLPDAWRFEVATWEDGQNKREHHLRMRCPVEQCLHAPLPGDALLASATLLQWDPPSHPAQLDGRALMLARGLAARGTIKELHAHEVPRHPGVTTRISRGLASTRLGLEALLLESLPQDRAAWIMAMTLGSRGLLHPGQRAPFDLTGTSHLLAISGLHLGALAALLWWLVARVARRITPNAIARHGLRTICAFPISLTMLAYVIMIGAPSSARRALMMLFGALTAHLLVKRLAPLEALAMAILLALAWRPWAAHEPALLLSVSATLGILLIVKSTTEDSSRNHQRTSEGHLAAARDGVKNLCKISFAAWLATSPVVLWLGVELPVLGAALNLIFVPLVSALIFPAMVLGMVLLPWLPLLGVPLLELAAMAMEGMHALAAYTSVLPGAFVRPGFPSAGWILPYGALVASWFVASGGGQRARWSILAAAILALAAPACHRRAQQRGDLTIDFIDVGQGDATLVTLPDGQTLLIDAGGSASAYDPGMRQVLPHLRWRGVHMLDGALLTHADMDHMRGFFSVAALATPRFFYTDPRQRDVKEHTALIEEMERHGSTTRHVKEDVLLLGSARGARIKALVPFSSSQDASAHERNDLSLTLLVEYAGVHIVLPGDLEQDGERWLAAHPEISRLASRDGGITILKMGHHGSKTSSSDVLLDVLDPAMGIASAGKRNRFGHPAPEILARYHQRGASVWRTDRDGLISVSVSADGEITVHTARDR